METSCLDIAQWKRIVSAMNFEIFSKFIADKISQKKRYELICKSLLGLLLMRLNYEKTKQQLIHAEAKTSQLFFTKLQCSGLFIYKMLSARKFNDRALLNWTSAGLLY